MLFEGLLVGPAVDVDLFLLYLDRVSGDTDHPFDEIHGMVPGEGEDDDVSPFGHAIHPPKLVCSKRHGEAVVVLCRKDMIALKEGIFHG